MATVRASWKHRLQGFGCAKKEAVKNCLLKSTKSKKIRNSLPSRCGRLFIGISKSDQCGNNFILGNVKKISHLVSIKDAHDHGTYAVIVSGKTKCLGGNAGIEHKPALTFGCGAGAILLHAAAALHCGESNNLGRML